jgi:hypothetical protein
MLREFRNAFKFKIAPHKQKSIVKIIGRKMGPCTPKHNGKSGTVNENRRRTTFIYQLWAHEGHECSHI